MASYNKTVRYKLTKIEADAYRPTKPGINCTFGDYDFINNEVTVHYACADYPNLAPECRRTMEDIEEEISRMEPRLIKESKVDLKLPFHHAMKFMLDHHSLDGQFDYMRSKAVMTGHVKMPKMEIREINKFYEKEKIKPMDEYQKEYEVGEIIE